MVNPFTEVNWQPGLAERRKFARSLVIGFPCVAVAVLLLGWARKGAWDANLALALGLGGGGALAGAIFYVVPQIARPFYVAWYFLACCIGFVVGNLLLGGFFYLVITPFGLVKRLVKPTFAKGFDKSASTYWREAAANDDPARYYKQF